MNTEKDISIKISTQTTASTSTNNESSTAMKSGKCPVVHGVDKSIGQMHVGSQKHSMQIPTDDLSGIEHFNEAMQIFFRDAYNLSKIFSVIMALKMEIFEIINSTSSSGMTLQQIHVKLPVAKVPNAGFTERHLRDLLCELGAQGYLETEGGLDSHTFGLTDLTKKFFLLNSPNSVCRMYMNVNRYMKNFQEAMVSNFAFGSKPQNHSQDVFTNENETGMVMDYFYKTAQPSFDKMMNIVDFSNFSTVMDVRGSYGLLSTMIKKKCPAVSCISFDNVSLQTYACEKIAQLGMQNEVTVQSGSLLNGQLPQADCVIAPFVFMHYNDENCLKIMKHLFSCLSASKGSQLVILENLMDTEWKDCKALTMSFMMGIQNCEGNARTFNEFMVMLMSAGFKTVDRIQLGPGMADLMIAMK